MRYLVIILSLLFSTNVNARIIEMKKCDTEDTKFDPSKLVERKFVIDGQRNVVSMVIIYQSEYLEKEKKKYAEKYGKNAAAEFRKVKTISYPIQYFGTEYVEAIKKGHEGRDQGYVVNLKNKTVEVVSSFFNFNTTWKCK